MSPIKVPNATPLETAILNLKCPNGTIMAVISEPVTVKIPVHELAAALESAFVLIPRDELPEVFNHSDYAIAGANRYAVEGNFSNGQRHRNQALEYIAVWQHLEAREAELKSSENKRLNRRGELWVELGGHEGDVMTPALDKALERIIELEGGK